MSLTVRRRHDRGHFQHGWLETYHTFSFGDFFDPEWTQFRSLRVMNEDVVAAGQGFGMHGHRDMEIVTWVLSGELEHRDSLGHGEILRPGEMQFMSAGSGIRHSEFNPSATTPAHLYQIWLLPEQPQLTPTYDQRAFGAEGRQNRWQTLAARDGREGALPIRSNAVVSVAELSKQARLSAKFAPDRSGWLQVTRGEVQLTPELILSAGDGVACTRESMLEIVAVQPSEVLLFDLG